jgi:hypothetical protein
MNLKRFAGIPIIAIGLIIGLDTVARLLDILQANDAGLYPLYVPLIGLIGTICLIILGIGMLTGWIGPVSKITAEAQRITSLVAIAIIAFLCGLLTVVN